MVGAQRLAADTLDRLFAPTPGFGGQMVVKEATTATDLPGQKKRKFNGVKALRFVEMRGLEPRTPYMRSKCSTSLATSPRAAPKRPGGLYAPGWAPVKTNGETDACFRAFDRRLRGARLHRYRGRQTSP